MSTLFSGHCLRNRSTLDIGVLGYIGIVRHKEHSPEVLSIPPGTPCITTTYCALRWAHRFDTLSNAGHQALRSFTVTHWLFTAS